MAGARRTSRATTSGASSGTSPRAPGSRTCASSSPSACSSRGSCSTRRRRWRSAPASAARPTSPRASRSRSATRRRGAATGSARSRSATDDDASSGRGRAVARCSTRCSCCATCRRAARARLRDALELADTRRRASARSSIVVSDFRGPLDWRAPLLRLAGRHTVLAVEVRDPREQELADVGELRLVDPGDGPAAARRHRRPAPARALRRPRPRDERRALVGERSRRPACGTSRSRPRATGCGRSPRSCAGGSRPVSFAAPLLLLFLLVVPVAVAALPLARAAPRRARRGVGAAGAAPEHGASGRRAWRRHLPTALLLVGVALLLVGFARPQRVDHVSSGRTRRSCSCSTSPARWPRTTRSRRASARRAAAALRFVDKLPQGYRMALVTFSDHARRRRAADARPDAHARRARRARSPGPQGTALADAVARAVDVGDVGQGPRRRASARRRSSSCSPTAARPPGRVTPQQAAAEGAEGRHPGVNSVSSARRTASCTSRSRAASPSSIQVPAQPQSLQQIAQASGGRFYAEHRPPSNAKAIYAELGSRVGRKQQDGRGDGCGGGRRARSSCSSGGLLSGLWFRRVP